MELQRSIDSLIGDMEEKLQDRLTSRMDWTDGKIVDLRQALEVARKSIAAEIAKIQSA